MGLFATVLSFLGFGWGIGVGLLIGYFLFVYSLPSKVEVRPGELCFLTRGCSAESPCNAGDETADFDCHA